MKPLAPLVGVVALAAALVTAPTAGTAAPAAPEARELAAASTSARALLGDLKVRKQTPGGYARTKFRHWVDADGDCEDTRAEVLRAESGTGTGGACSVTTGTWRSVYDGRMFSSASGLDVDHLVPLAEAWRSGAKRWTPGTRKRFANDLGYSQSLIAVSASTNRSKGDREPQRWMPPNVDAHCAYVSSWVAVKWRWRLAVHKPEKRFLRREIRACGNPTFTRPQRADVTLGTGGGSGGSRGGGSGGGGGTGGGGGGGGGTDPRFDYCYNAIDAGYGPYYRGSDPEYYWYDDADGDGVVCES